MNETLTDDLQNVSVLWRRLDLPGHEACRLITRAGEPCVSGTAVFFSDSQPCRLDYSIVCDSAWRTRQANIVGWVGNEAIDLEILVDQQGQWSLKESACAAVAGCIDIDLNFSPSTNTLPIRRLSLAVGERAEVRAAWLRFPSFQLEPLVQMYERLDHRRYRYESDGGRFVAELEVNSAGLVTVYEDLWRIEESHN